jgi:putative oxidoreductase
MKYIVLLGRILYSLMFLNSGLFLFSGMAADYASSKGVPLASFLVPFSGVMAIVGGLLIVLGYKAKLGAWLIVAFLIPVTFIMHAFWKETDPNQMQMQISNFLKNISMLGGAFLIIWFGAGPLSFDNRRKAG